MTDLSKMGKKVGFIGAGNMASALIRGMLAKGLAPTNLFVCDLDQEKTAALKSELQIGVETDSSALAAQVDVIVLAVKPGTIVPLLTALDAADKLWISVAAGIPCDDMESALGEGARVVRVMPNTPALIGEGASGLAAGAHATGEDLELATSLMSAVGITELVSESTMDAVTGLSGSGPAYVMLMIEAMADGAVRAGLPRPAAMKLAAQTVRGAATLVLETGKHPGELKDMVTSPGGTTIAGVQALEASGFRDALISAVTAAAQRSAELSGR